MVNRMTEEQLKPYEMAARIYCKKKGHNPDEAVPVPSMVLHGQFTSVPLWHMAAEKLIDISFALQSIREAHEATETEQ